MATRKPAEITEADAFESHRARCPVGGGEKNESGSVLLNYVNRIAPLAALRTRISDCHWTIAAPLADAARDEQATQSKEHEGGRLGHSGQAAAAGRREAAVGQPVD